MDDSDAMTEPLLATLYGGQITQGPKVDEFEQALISVTGNPFTATVNSGTSALTLAVRLCDAGPGDEVISTPMTCSATNEAILASGATIVWADVDRYSGLIDPLSVGVKLTPNTKAIMAVDWGGAPCDYDLLRQVAPHVPIIADAAHALGSTYKGRSVGTLADYTCFSFQAIKHLTTVDGGAITCSDAESYQRAKRLRWFGIDREIFTDFRGGIDIPEWGYKMHMNDVTAQIGLVNLHNKLPGTLKRHREISRRYHKEFNPLFVNTWPDYEHDSTAWLYTMLVADPDKFKRVLGSHDIATSKVHARNDNFACFASSKTHLPGLDSFSERMICIPINAAMTDSDVDKIIEVVKNYEH